MDAVLFVDTEQRQRVGAVLGVERVDAECFGQSRALDPPALFEPRFEQGQGDVVAEQARRADRTRVLAASSPSWLRSRTRKRYMPLRPNSGR
jgi:hypothetical protein